MSPIIQLNNIHKVYHLGDAKLEVLKAINLKIYAGECVAIMGPSGSGKSSIMNIIGLLDRPSNGEYLLRGSDVTHLNDNELASTRNKTIGFVFQSFYLLSRLNALQNVLLPTHYSSQPIHFAKKTAMDMLARVEMVNYALRRPMQLSGGQQQRVAIARALMNKPNILLADEPTGALDSKTGDTILNLFMQLNKEQGTTTIIITHDANVAARCERIIHLKDGHIRAEEGS